MIRLARFRLDEPRHLGHHGAFGQPVDRLADDAKRLPELLQPDEIPVVGVPVRAERHVEFELVVGGVGFVFPHIPVDPGPAQRRATQTQCGRRLAGDHPDPTGALEPDPVVGEQRLVLRDLGLHDVAKRMHLATPAGRDIEREPTDPHAVVGQPGATVLLEQIENELTLTQGVHEHRHRPDVHGVSAQPETMTGDPLELGEDGADVSRPPGHLHLHQLLDRLAVALVVRGGRDVVHPVGQQDDLGPVPVLGQLLDAPMDVPHDYIGVDDPFAVESQDHPQHPMGAGMLWAHVDDELVGVEHRRCFDGHDLTHVVRLAIRSPPRPAGSATAATPSGSPAGTRPALRAGSPSVADAPASSRASGSGADPGAR